MTEPVSPGAVPIDPTRVNGHWQWSHSEERDGVRQIENEHWILKLDGRTLRGEYDRTITFLSLDGVPFECSQALSYRLSSHYRVRGTVDSRHFRVVETTYDVSPSPCEGGFRRTGEYRGALVDDSLILKWDGGRQTLFRAPAPSSRAVRKVSAAGHWHWVNRGPGPDRTVRVEREEWQLHEAAGAITGTYLRSVTVFDPEGTVFECSGDTYYTYRDRYTVRGSRTGQRVILSEIGVAAEPNPCLAHVERHLDTAVGRVGDGFFELEWRGRHRQVLHRPNPHTAQR